MQQIYRRTLMPKCDFNKVPKQLYWNRTSAWVFSCKFAAYFQSTFPKKTSGQLFLETPSDSYPTRFSNIIVQNQKPSLRKRKFQIFLQGLAIWNNFFGNIEQELEYRFLFKARVKTKILDVENEVTCQI